MLDLNWIKSNPKDVEIRLQKKGYSIDFSSVIEQDNQRKKWLLEIEQVKAEVNKLSASVPLIKKQGGDVQTIFAQVKTLNASIQEKELLMKQTEEAILRILHDLPNVPDDDLKEGGKENNEFCMKKTKNLSSIFH
jgi:seryl-tRNA synthetase